MVMKDTNSYWRPNWDPTPINCNCACSICLSGSCCMYPARNWWPPTLVWPYVTPPYTTITTTGASLEVRGCPRCGETKFGVRYHTGTWPSDGGCDHSQKLAEGPLGEHIHRTCQTCGWNWRDPILGAEK